MTKAESTPRKVRTARSRRDVLARAPADWNLLSLGRRKFSIFWGRGTLGRFQSTFGKEMDVQHVYLE